MNSKLKNARVLIVGGGVSGASLAIRLAREDLEVVLVEKDKFPRHKLCGEFVSPECLAHFESLGVLDQMAEIGGDSIHETRFFAQNGKSIAVPSEWFFNGNNGALGISRSEMDFCLLRKAGEDGVTVLEETAVADVNIKDNILKSISIRNKSNRLTDIKADLVIDATGRSRVLGKLIEKERRTKTRKRKVQHVGFKTHLRNVRLDRGVCEIYFFRGGYGGLSYVENGTANHCFLIDSRVVREFKGNPERIVNEVIFKNARAFEMMENAQKKFDWLAVSVERFGRQPTNNIANLIPIGDASAFIDPFTGSGMLMALESSKILADVISCDLSRLAPAKISIFKAEYEMRHSSAIGRRLRICAIMRKLSFSSTLVNPMISVASISNRLLQKFTSLTRPHRKFRF